MTWKLCTRDQGTETKGIRELVMKKLPNWADTKSGNKNVVEIIDILTDEDNAEEWDPEASVPGPSIRNAAKKRTGVYVWRGMKVN